MWSACGTGGGGRSCRDPSKGVLSKDEDLPTGCFGRRRSCRRSLLFDRVSTCRVLGAVVMAKSVGLVDDDDKADLPSSPPLLSRLSRRAIDVGDESLCTQQVGDAHACGEVLVGWEEAGFSF